MDRFREAERVYLPFIALAELRAGFLCGTQSRRNERVLTRFLNSPRVRVLYADEQTTQHYARLFQQLRQQATPIPTKDIWIAALAIQHDLPLFARDSHFDRKKTGKQDSGAGELNRAQRCVRGAQRPGNLGLR